jgi:hypothetical protein
MCVRIYLDWLSLIMLVLDSFFFRMEVPPWPRVSGE